MTRCTHCKKELTGQQKKYCSRSCAGIHTGPGRTYKYLEQWIAGKHNASKQNGTLSPAARKYLVNSVGGLCPLCGWDKPNPVSGQVILTVDHKDGDWTNNYYDNLTVMCYNCHTLTPTSGALNRGKGITKRPGGFHNRTLKEVA